MYVVYANESEKKVLQTGSCSRTKPTEYAGKEMAELEEVKVKKEQQPEGR